jgi:hypothetical protein
MLFPLRQQILAASTGNALGSTVNFGITRDFFLDSLVVEISGTVTGAAATIGPDTMLGLVQNLTLQIADGSSNRNHTQVMGPTAIQKAFTLTGAIDQSTLNGFLIGGGVGTFLLRFPLLFKNPSLSDPIGSAFLLPLPRYNTNPVLSVLLATQAQMDQNAAPTFAIAAGISVRLVINKRQVDNINFPTVMSEFIENSVSYPTTGPGQLYEMQVPGTYFMFGLRGYSGAAASVVWADPTSANGQLVLQILGNTLRQCFFSDLQYQNQMSAQDNWSVTSTRSQKNGLFPGVAIYNFLHDGFGLEVGEVGSSLNANVLAGSGSRVQLLQDITGSATTRIAYFWDRVFGDLSSLKLNLPGEG